MENEKRLIDAKPLMQNGWHLVRTGESNRFLGSMSLADVPPVDAVEVVHGRWRIETDEEEPNPMFKLVVCSACKEKANDTYNYCPNCGAKMDGDGE